MTKPCVFGEAARRHTVLHYATHAELDEADPLGSALRHAQLTTLAKYPHPYFWAAYQLTGEAR